MAAAGRSGVTCFLVPGIDLETSIAASRLSDTRSCVFAAAGIHPNDLGTGPDFGMEGIPEVLIGPGVIAVGETGMDLYHERSAEERQREAFLRHIEMAEAFGLTLVVHSRGAEAQVLDTLGENVTVPVVMHCYTGPVDLAQKACARGFYIGFAGPVTYAGNGRLREMAACLPKDRILAETDSPYLSPEPVRGGRNEPANLVYTVETISEALGEDLDSTARQLRSNSMKAFQLCEHRRTDLIYRVFGNLYMNITGRCANHCRFCIRDRTDGLGGYYLRHAGEPEERRLRGIAALLPEGFGRELVFCGYGEPTMRPLLLRELALAASGKGYSVRLDTNGTCLLNMSIGQVLDMLEPFAAVSVSLNASSEEEYSRLCRPEDPGAWKSLMDFIQLAGARVRLEATAVRYPGVDIGSVSELAGSLGLPFRVR